MAHFTQLDANNVVIWVTFLDDDLIKDSDGNVSEALGIEHIHKTIPDSNQYTWKQTSQDGSFRKRYAGIGYSYNETLDAFILPKPYESWVLNEEANWESPVGPAPALTQEQIDSNSIYDWNEETGSWELFTALVPSET